MKIKNQLISDICKSVEEIFDTKVNDSGVLQIKEGIKINVHSIDNFFNDSDEIVYIVVPVFKNLNKIIINNYYETWSYNHSPTRYMESFFNIDYANKKLENQLKSLGQLILFLEGIPCVKKVIINSFSELPLNKNPSKIIDKFESLQWVLKENEIDICGYNTILLKIEQNKNFLNMIRNLYYRILNKG